MSLAFTKVRPFGAGKLGKAKFNGLFSSFCRQLRWNGMTISRKQRGFTLVELLVVMKADPNN